MRRMKTLESRQARSFARIARVEPPHFTVVVVIIIVGRLASDALVLNHYDMLHIVYSRSLHTDPDGPTPRPASSSLCFGNGPV